MPSDKGLNITIRGKTITKDRTNWYGKHLGRSHADNGIKSI